MPQPKQGHGAVASERRAGAVGESVTVDRSRRRFLFTLGAGSAGAAVAATAPAVAATELAPPAAGTQDAAYRVTEHVRDYYRSAGI